MHHHPGGRTCYFCIFFYFFLILFKRSKTCMIPGAHVPLHAAGFAAGTLQCPPRKCAVFHHLFFVFCFVFCFFLFVTILWPYAEYYPRRIFPWLVLGLDLFAPTGEESVDHVKLLGTKIWWSCRKQALQLSVIVWCLFHTCKHLPMMPSCKP